MPSSPPPDAGRQLHPKIAAAIQRLHINLGQFTPNTTKTVLGAIFDREGVIREIHFAPDAVPNDADGTLLIHVDVQDISEGALDNIVNALDAEVALIAAKKGVKAVLVAESAENERTVQAGDVLQFRLVNNSAAIDTNPNIIATVLYQITDLVEGFA
jgi:hypothetical protein